MALAASVVLSVVFLLFAIDCTGKSPHTNLPSAVSAIGGSSPSASEPSTSTTLPLRTLRDVPLSGGATRFDYQSFDANTGRLYIAHLGDGSMKVFDVEKEMLLTDVKGLSRVHGVLAVPDLHRVYASATGSNELAIIDDSTLQIVARAPAGDYPDGIAYASKANKIYVLSKLSECDASGPL